MEKPPIKFAGNLQRFLLSLFFTTGILITSCTPTIRIETPSEPITINLNVKIEHEIRIRVDRELDDLFKTEDDLF
ncbi:MAG: YnbE family lipoprotein [Gammaproteobacteria bacterium]|nr:YnbE family lipoprotein [Gammaproteobacteria bacterium]